MFDKLKQWTAAKGSSLRHDQLMLTQWAKSHGFESKLVTGQAKGLVIEWPTLAGRLEWGPSQRAYLQGHELRWRAEGLPGSDAQMVCMSRAMVRLLESDEFDQISDDQQKTVIDVSLPDEVRWLAMLPKAPWAQATAVGAHFAMMCRHEPLLKVMRDPRVCQALMSAEDTWWTDELLGVLTHNRGWLTLRMSASGLSEEQLEGTLSLLQVLAQTMKARRADA